MIRGSLRLAAQVAEALVLFWLVAAAPAAQRGTQGPPASAATQTPPPLPWAFPAVTPGFQREPDDGQPKHVSGSTAAFTQPQIDDPFAPPEKGSAGPGTMVAIAAYAASLKP
jgi:hypothetical protein